VPGAINVPLPTLLLSPLRVPGSRDAAVVVYCGQGPRARMAAAMMRRAGFRRIIFIRGHMAGWRKAGLREEN
jgi:rhodanese-related sulfurtransferase